MIKVTLGRTNSGHVCKPQHREENAATALSLLVNCELAWGATIMVCEPTRIETKTIVLHCVDTTVLEGTIEEMESLYEICIYYLAGCQHDEIAMESAFNKLSQINNGEGVLPLHLAMAGGKLVGENRIKIALLLGCGIKEKAELETLVPYSLGDLVAALQLKQEMPQISLQEFLT